MALVKVMLCLHMPHYSEERIPEFKIHGFGCLVFELSWKKHSAVCIYISHFFVALDASIGCFLGVPKQIHSVS